MAKYIQKNKGIFVRLDTQTLEALTLLANERRWSMASTVAYCVEQQMKLAPSISITRR